MGKLSLQMFFWTLSKITGFGVDWVLYPALVILYGFVTASIVVALLTLAISTLVLILYQRFEYDAIALEWFKDVLENSVDKLEQKWQPLAWLLRKSGLWGLLYLASAYQPYKIVILFRPAHSYTFSKTSAKHLLCAWSFRTLVWTSGMYVGENIFLWIWNTVVT